MMLMIPGPSTTMKIAGNRQKMSGNRILIGTFWAGLLTQHVRDRHTQLGGLDDDGAERPQLVDVRTLAERPQSVHTRPSNLHLLEDAGELAGHRSAAVPGELGQGGVEAQTGLDADRQRIEDVGQRAGDLLLPVVRELVDDQVGGEEPADGAEHSAAERAQATAEEQPDDGADDAEDDQAEALDLEDAIDRPVRRVTRVVEPPTQPGQGGARRGRTAERRHPPADRERAAPPAVAATRPVHAVDRRQAAGDAGPGEGADREVGQHDGDADEERHHGGDHENGGQQVHAQASTLTTRAIQKTPMRNSVAPPTTMMMPSGVVTSGVR
jgi:hypothetical protein